MDYITILISATLTFILLLKGLKLIAIALIIGTLIYLYIKNKDHNIYYGKFKDYFKL
jgi:hypothetical protein